MITLQHMLVLHALLWLYPAIGLGELSATWLNLAITVAACIAAAAAKKERSVEATFELIFDPLLPLAGDTPEKLAERLGKFASGAAYVAAAAQG